ncbi:MAG: Hsp20/alpha crystallin family protein [Syntrophotaleaceae bacterium]
MTERNTAFVNNRDKDASGREETRPRNSYLSPAVDIYETEEALVFTADLPGMPKEAVNIHVEKGILTIQGQVAEQEQGERLIGEFAAGPYYRQFRIPDTVDPSKAGAEFKNGVLTLTLPRAEKAKPRRIEISTS